MSTPVAPTTCVAACWAQVDCTVCKMRKAPLGRDVGAAASGGYCGWDCPGYTQPPKPGHLWPGEAGDPIAESTT